METPIRDDIHYLCQRIKDYNNLSKTAYGKIYPDVGISEVDLFERLRKLLQGNL